MPPRLAADNPPNCAFVHAEFFEQIPVSDATTNVALANRENVRRREPGRGRGFAPLSAFGVSPRAIGVSTGSPFKRTLARHTPPGQEMVGVYAPPRSACLRNHLMGWDLTDADHVGEPMRIHT